MVKKRHDYKDEEVIDVDEANNEVGNEKTINEQKEKIIQLEKCLKDKDKRISKIEERWENIISFLSTIFYGFFICFSYYLVFFAWIFIATNGAWKNGIVDIIVKNIHNYMIWFSTPTELDENITYPSQNIMPQVLSNESGLLLAIIMIIILSLLSICWLLWFTRDGEEIL